MSRQLDATVDVIVLSWTEYERGWGSRPDGYTAYRSIKDMQRHVDAHARDLLRQYGPDAPDEYSAPDSEAAVYRVSAAAARALLGEKQYTWVSSDWLTAHQKQRTRSAIRI